MIDNCGSSDLSCGSHNLPQMLKPKPKKAINNKTESWIKNLLALAQTSCTSTVTGFVVGSTLLNKTNWLFTEVQDVRMLDLVLSVFRDIEDGETSMLDVNFGARVRVTWLVNTRVKFARVIELEYVTLVTGVTVLCASCNVFLLHRFPVQHSIEQLLTKPCLLWHSIDSKNPQCAKTEQFLICSTRLPKRG